MGKVQEPEPAALIVGALFREEEPLSESLRLLADLDRPWRRLEGEVAFDYTDYYRREMGTGLRRGLLVLEQPVARDRLAWWKQQTNAIEMRLADDRSRRMVNLDPGLLSLENLVLATTKGRDHRVYLGQGIYAEVTLRYHQGRFQALEWTYADWKHPRMFELLEDVRGWLYRELKRMRREA